MAKLTKVTESGGCWYPVSIAELDGLLIKVIRRGRGYRHTYALRRNIAYNLQHIEFLDRCLEDLKLSSVLVTQTWKTFIVVGCGIIESLLHFLLIARDVHSTIDWELKVIAPGNPKTVDGERIRVDSHIYRRLPSSKLKQMTFDAMLKKAERNKVLGSDHSVYASLKKLRQLRNKVHLQEIGHSTDTDWNAFQRPDVALMAKVVYKVFTSNIFQPSREERGYFAYLRSYCDDD